MATASIDPASLGITPDSISPAQAGLSSIVPNQPQGSNPAVPPAMQAQPQFRGDIGAIIQQVQAKYPQLPTGLIPAMVQVESGGNPAAVSKAGAQGIAQIMPGTAQRYGINPHDPVSAIDGMARILLDNYRQLGDWTKAITAYNSGVGGVQSGHWAKVPESAQYAGKVLGAMRQMGSSPGTPSNDPFVVNTGSHIDPVTMNAALSGAYANGQMGSTVTNPFGPNGQSGQAQQAPSGSGMADGTFKTGQPSWNQAKQIMTQRGMTPEQIENARQLYFRDVVAPNYNPSELPFIKQKFDSDTNPTPSLGQRAAGVGLGLLKGAMGMDQLPIDAARWVGNTLDPNFDKDNMVGRGLLAASNWLQQGIDAAQAMKPQKIQELEAQNIISKDSQGNWHFNPSGMGFTKLMDTMAEAAPQMLPMMVGGGAVAAAGRAAELPEFAANYLGYGLGNAGTFGAQTFAGTQREYAQQLAAQKNEDGTPKYTPQQIQQMATNAAVNSGGEVAGLTAATGGLGDALAIGTAGSVARRAILGGAKAVPFGAADMGGQRAIQNVNEGKPAIDPNTAEAAIMGGTMGAPMAGALAAMHGHAGKAADMPAGESPAAAHSDAPVNADEVIGADPGEPQGQAEAQPGVNYQDAAINKFKDIAFASPTATRSNDFQTHLAEETKLDGLVQDLKTRQANDVSLSRDDIDTALKSSSIPGFDDPGAHQMAGDWLDHALNGGERPAPAFHIGSETTAHMPSGMKVAGHYAVVEASQLTTSHDGAMRENPLYPTERQPRDRTRATSAQWVHETSNKIVPEWLGESAKVSDGAPWVDKTGVVDSGNGRTLALTRAYVNGKADAYRQHLIDHADDFGINPDQVAQMHQPVLVRVRQTDVDPVEFAREANESDVAQMSATETAQSDAEKMPSLDTFHVSENGTVDHQANDGWIRAFVNQVVPKSEMGGMYGPNGRLSKTGLQRVQNAVLAKAYGNSDMISRILESTDNNIRNITNGLLRAAPAVAKMREDIKDGALHDVDVTHELINAVQEFSRLRDDGVSLEQHLAQLDILNAKPYNDDVLAILKFLDENSRSPRRIADFITNYARALNEAGLPGQDLFGECPTPSSQDLIGKATEGVNPDESQAGHGGDEVQPQQAEIKEPAEANAGADSAAGRGENARAEGNGRPVGSESATGSETSVRTGSEPVTESQVKAEVKKLKEKLQPKSETKSAKPETPVLPRELAGAKPRYSYGQKQFDLKFPDDVHKALYIVAQKTPSKADAQYMDFLRSYFEGKSDDEIRGLGSELRDQIKPIARDQDPGRQPIIEVPELRAKDIGPAKLQKEESVNQGSVQKADSVNQEKPADINQDEFDKAKEDFTSSLGELLDWASDQMGHKKNVVPNFDRKTLTRILTDVMDAALRMGKVKFKQNAKFVLDTLRAKGDVGKSLANALHIDDLRGAYLGMAHQHRDKGADDFSELARYTDIAHIDAPDTERRKDIDTRKKIDQMSADELRREILTDQLTGLGNRRAYEDSTKLPFQASIDADGLKWVNDNLGHESGDQLLKLIGQALKEETDESYHISGDEFVVQRENKAELQSILERASERLQDASIKVALPDGSTIEKKGLGFSYGIGRDLTEAESGLREHKSERERQGLRAPRGGEPAGVVRTAAEGQQDHLSHIATQEEVTNPIDVAAHEAATSPHNDLPEPTEAQKEAGNYKLGHIHFQGLDISIENPQGSKRSGIDRDGMPWEVEMQHHYGYIRGTVGRDKDHLDVFIGPNHDSQQVYVIDQKEPSSGRFDEHKIMLGFDDRQAALDAYHANYAKDWQGMGTVTPMDMAQFKDWIKGDTTRPLSYQEPGQFNKGEEHAADSGAGLEPDSAGSGHPDGVGERALPDEPGRADAGDGQRGESTGEAGDRAAGDHGVSGARPATDGTRVDQPLREEAPGNPAPDTGSAGDQRSLALGEQELASDHIPAGRIEAAVAKPLDLSAKREAQRRAESIKVKRGDLGNIRETLPFLLPAQQEDVHFAELRHASPDGQGVLFTNGTGTGKTYTGLGIVKRFDLEGRRNILIVAPSDSIIAAWIRSGKDLNVDIHQLEHTEDNGGKAIAATTYANFGTNRTLADRDWDLVLTDESHYLAANANGDLTDAGRALRAITYHERGFHDWLYMKERARYDKLQEARRSVESLTRSANNLDTDQFGPDIARAVAHRDALEQEWNGIQDKRRAEWDAVQDAKKPRVVFLSATPFAYVKSVDYAEGYLFRYHEGEGEEPTGSRYNSGNAYQRFYMQHFGYRMRYNKLTAPPPEVNTTVMEQEFNRFLKARGALSGRMLDVDADYDRRFVLSPDAIGQKIDEGLNFLRDAEEGRYGTLAQMVEENFDYHHRMYLLEALKARQVIPEIQERLASGKYKVVVFHDFKKGGGFHPFRFSKSAEHATVEYRKKDGSYVRVKLNDLINEFNAKRPDLVELDFSNLLSPIQAFQRQFSDVLLFNGDIPKRERVQNVTRFNDDNSGRNLILVQTDAGKEGISLHDTTGKFQRVEYNLGLPVKPTAAIQQEGRIYRTGQVSNAIFRYLNTGTDFERMAFAQKIAARASTAENLALGPDARALKEAFVEAFLDSGHYPPGMEGEGTGGKSRDRAAAASLTPFDRALAHYWGQQKNSATRANREGKDYYATPEPLGFKMVSWSDIRRGEKGLEPSAGHGAIARYFPEDADVTMIEPSYELGSRAALVAPHQLVTDTFENHHIVNKYDAIAMNPPFGVGGKTSTEHLAKAWQHLKEGGRLVALLPGGGKASERMNELYSKIQGAHVVANIKLPAVTFEKAGTAIRTHVVVLEKHFDEAIGRRIDARTRNIDLSGETDINDLFNRLRDIDLPEREKTAAMQAAEEVERLANLNKNPPKEAANGVEYALTEFRHTKTGEMQYVARPSEHLGDRFGEVRDLARQHGGRYNSFGSKEMKGFLFKSPEERASFMDALKKSDDTVRFHRQFRHPDGKGMDAKEAQGIADSIRQHWKNAPDITTVQSIHDLPERYQRQIYEKGAQYDTQGFLLTKTGKIYLVADNMNREDVPKVVLHEALGHYGLRGVFGNDLDNVLRMVYTAKKADADEIARRYEIDLSHEDGRLEAAEEVLAHMAQENRSNMFLDRAVAVARSWLRRFMPDLKMSDAEIRNILANARRHVEKGETTIPDGSDSDEGRFSRAKSGDFGPVLTGLGGDFRGAVDALMHLHDGEVPDALFHSNLGHIDLVWGKPGTAAKNFEDGYGLSHILAKHPEINPYDLEHLIMSAKIKSRHGNTVELETHDHMAIIKLDWFGKEKKWLLSAFEKPAAIDERIGVADGAEPGPLPGQEAGSEEGNIDQKQEDDNGDEGIRFLRSSGNPEDEAPPVESRPPKRRAGPIDTVLQAAGGRLLADRITKPAYDWLLRHVGELVPEKIKAGVIDRYGVPEDAVDRSKMTYVAMQKAARESATYIEKLSVLNRAQSRIAYEWMNTHGDVAHEEALLAQLPEESRKVLQQLKTLIDKMGQEAVRLKQLSPEAYERNKMAYLHRMYDEHELDMKSLDKAKRDSIRQVLADQYKGRGMTKEVSMRQMAEGDKGFWERKLIPGKADKGLKGQKVVMLERYANSGKGTTRVVLDKDGNVKKATVTGYSHGEGTQNFEGGSDKPMGRVVERIYVPEGTDIETKYPAFHSQGTWEVRDVKGDKVVLWRDFTPEERVRMGELDEVKYAVARTLHMMSQSIETGRYFEWLSQNYAKKSAEDIPDGHTLLAKDETYLHSLKHTFAKDEWVQVPESKAPGTDVHKYGILAGRYVPGPIWNDMRSITRRSPITWDWYNSFLCFWKGAKTALSPTVHINNTMANFFMADFHDVGARDILQALQTAIRAKQGDKEAQAIIARFEDSGATHGMFTVHDLRRETIEPLEKALREELGRTLDQQSALVKASMVVSLLKDGAFREAFGAAKMLAGQSKALNMVKKGATGMEDLYNFEDSIFRLAMFHKGLREGVSDYEAGKAARTAFHDYDIHAPWINAMRQTAFPFLAFPYRMIPMVARTLAEKPWKPLKWMAVAGTLNALSYAMLGYGFGGGQQQDKERALLPDEKGGKIWGIIPKLMRMPWNDTDNNPVFLDIRRFIPLGDFFDMGEMHTALPISPSLMVGGPLSMAAEFLSNKNFFTGKDITMDTMTTPEKIAAYSKYLWQSIMPNIAMLPGTYAWNSISDALHGKTDAFGREQSVGQALTSSVGVKLGSYPSDVGMQNAYGRFKHQDNELRRELYGVEHQYRQHGIGEDEYNKDVEQIQDKRQQLGLEFAEKVRKGQGQ